jgi:hypothetical protein
MDNGGDWLVHICRKAQDVGEMRVQDAKADVVLDTSSWMLASSFGQVREDRFQGQVGN